MPLQTPAAAALLWRGTFRSGGMNPGRWCRTPGHQDTSENISKSELVLPHSITGKRRQMRGGMNQWEAPNTAAMVNERPHWKQRGKPSLEWRATCYPPSCDILHQSAGKCGVRGISPLQYRPSCLQVPLLFIKTASPTDAPKQRRCNFQSTRTARDHSFRPEREELYLITFHDNNGTHIKDKIIQELKYIRQIGRKSIHTFVIIWIIIEAPTKLK
jgi:hypothetical protein